ncbi:hypothetical protein RI129_000857 [Pyrocoelia pectoralis]|uniref:Uncharacterized protein n=1 Tax=Pyrocoelia pectoralis TaxID=417401 RepID=A0AAN7VV62_9COLE
MLYILKNTIARSGVIKGCNFNTSSILCEEEVKRLPNETYKVNNFEKRILVWMGKYKNVSDVPAFVKPEVMEKSRSWMRVRISNYSIALTLVGCVIMIYTGKKARDRGDSLHKRNLDWHEEHRSENK